MTQSFDVLVIGSGIAGLSFALDVARRGRSVAILTKKDKADSSTNWAQGGLAAVTATTDDFAAHVHDTLAAGDGLCDPKVVRAIVRDGPACVRELAEWGVRFSRDPRGGYELGREGGHGARRILHAKDMTGRVIEEALLKAIAREPRIALFEHYFAIDVITRRKLSRRVPRGGDRVLGVHALDVRDGRVLTFRAPVVMLATGGAGQVYLYTTNPDIATGDGVAMAWRAGVEVRNMEFIQFHPTALYSTTGRRFLISEALRGEGAVLRNPLADLAPRDIVARAIDAEMKKSGAAHVWLDITHRNAAWLRRRFPQIFAACRAAGLNLAHDLIPVVPAAHYVCGGVATTIAAETSLPGLYACGEVACTGLHGANRLASNSLLEAVVMARRGAESVDRYLRTATRTPLIAIPGWEDLGGGDTDERVVIAHNWDELRRTMWDYVGIMRTTKRLERARQRITNLARETQDYYWNFSVDARLLELRNVIEVAGLIVNCALQRKESRGLHAISDHPRKLRMVRDSRLRRT